VCCLLCYSSAYMYVKIWEIIEGHVSTNRSAKLYFACNGSATSRLGVGNDRTAPLMSSLSHTANRFLNQ
jgi:hypothetical protein